VPWTGAVSHGYGYRKVGGVNPDDLRAAARARYYRRKAEDPERTRAESRRSSWRWRQNNSEPNDKRTQARAALRQALQRGLLERQSCESCGAEPAQAHHDSYDQPLNVRWLCQRCHGITHRRYRKEESTGLPVDRLVSDLAKSE
jgi:hypothetical protein